MRYYFGDFELDTECFRLRDLGNGGCEVHLEPKVYGLLLHLIENRQRVVLYKELVEIVWNGVVVCQSANHRCVTLARRAVDDRPCDARVIRTVPCYGYQFIGSLRDQPKACLEEPLSTGFANG